MTGSLNLQGTGRENMGLFSRKKEEKNSTSHIDNATSKNISEPGRGSASKVAGDVSQAHQVIDAKILDYVDISSPKVLFDQLMLSNVRQEFKPRSEEYCAIINSDLSEDGHLSEEAVQLITDIAKKNAENSQEAHWLLVFTKHPTSQKLATLVCLPDYHEAQAVAHNTRGMRYPDAVIQFIESQVDSIKQTINVNNLMGRPRVTTFFEGGIGGFSGEASSCLTHNLSDALPIMSAAWDKQLGLQNANAAAPSAGPGFGAGGSNFGSGSAE